MRYSKNIDVDTSNRKIFFFFFELNFDIKNYQQNTKGCLNSDNVKIPSKVKVITLHCTS